MKIVRWPSLLHLRDQGFRVISIFCKPNFRSRITYKIERTVKWIPFNSLRCSLQGIKIPWEITIYHTEVGSLKDPYEFPIWDLSFLNLSRQFFFWFQNHTTTGPFFEPRNFLMWRMGWDGRETFFFKAYIS